MKRTSETEERRGQSISCMSHTSRSFVKPRFLARGKKRRPFPVLTQDSSRFLLSLHPWNFLVIIIVIFSHFCSPCLTFPSTRKMEFSDALFQPPLLEWLNFRLFLSFTYLVSLLHSLHPLTHIAHSPLELNFLHFLQDKMSF